MAVLHCVIYEIWRMYCIAFCSIIYEIWCVLHAFCSIIYEIWCIALHFLVLHMCAICRCESKYKAHAIVCVQVPQVLFLKGVVKMCLEEYQTAVEVLSDG